MTPTFAFHIGAIPQVCEPFGDRVHPVHVAGYPSPARLLAENFPPDAILAPSVARKFKSPLRPEVTIHTDIDRLVKETIGMFAGLEGKGLDALGIVVVDQSNIKGDKTALHAGDPTPKPGEPLSYERFLEEVCKEFGGRFS